eukprot:6463395-Amphidinium_carterae.2
MLLTQPLSSQDTTHTLTHNSSPPLSKPTVPPLTANCEPLLSNMHDKSKKPTQCDAAKCHISPLCADSLWSCAGPPVYTASASSLIAPKSTSRGRTASDFGLPATSKIGPLRGMWSRLNLVSRKLQALANVVYSD